MTPFDAEMCFLNYRNTPLNRVDNTFVGDWVSEIGLQQRSSWVELGKGVPGGERAGIIQGETSCDLTQALRQGKKNPMRLGRNTAVGVYVACFSRRHVPSDKFPFLV